MTSGGASLLEDVQETCTLLLVTGRVQHVIEHTLMGLAGANLIEPGIACHSQVPQLCSCWKGGLERAVCMAGMGLSRWR